MSYKDVVAKYATADVVATRKIIENLTDDEQKIIAAEYEEDAIIHFLCDILETGEEE